jgi:GntR family transcriptional regulator
MLDARAPKGAASPHATPHAAEAPLGPGVMPLYAQLARIFRTQVSSGELKPGDSLPTEGEIGRAFAVSRITVREALRLLAEEGLVVRRPGRGTFVAGRSGLAESVWTAGTIEDIIQGGHRAARRYLGRRVLSASRGIAEVLRVPAGSRVVELQALLEVEGAPLAHLTITVRYALGRALTLVGRGRGPVVLLLAETAGVRVGEVDQWTTASLADRRVGDLLGVASGDPILVVERVFYDVTGRPLELAVNRYRTDRFRLHVRLQPTVAPPARRRSLVRILG